MAILPATEICIVDAFASVSSRISGTAVFGLHMPAWSFVIALCVLAAYALKLSDPGEDERLVGSRVELFR
ncbi:MAG: hypothetical protein ABJO38_09090 [Stappiaceae bacterium]